MKSKLPNQFFFEKKDAFLLKIAAVSAVNTPMDMIESVLKGGNNFIRDFSKPDPNPKRPFLKKGVSPRETGIFEKKNLIFSKNEFLGTANIPVSIIGK